MANRSQQFSVAVHMLCFLEFNKSGRTTSELLAMSVNANPAAIRRIMSKLAKAGLIASTLGTHAAITLTREAGQVTLLDVYRAVTEERQELFAIHRDTNPDCPVGSQMPYLMDGVYTQVQTVMESELAAVTIAQLVRDGIVKPR